MAVTGTVMFRFCTFHTFFNGFLFTNLNCLFSLKILLTFQVKRVNFVFVVVCSHLLLCNVIFLKVLLFCSVDVSLRFYFFSAMFSIFRSFVFFLLVLTSFDLNALHLSLRSRVRTFNAYRSAGRKTTFFQEKKVNSISIRSGT